MVRELLLPGKTTYLMRRFFFVAITLLLTAISAVGQGKSDIRLDTTQCWFGDVYKQGEPASYKLGFTNTGSEKLLIYKCTTQCPCIRVVYPKDPLSPGESGVIMVYYDASHQHAGDFRKHFTLSTNSQASPHKKVMVRGRVVECSPEPAVPAAKEVKKQGFLSRLFGKGS